MHAARKSKATYNLRVHIILHECVVVKLVFHVPSNNVFSTTQKKLSFVIVVTSVSTNHLYRAPFVLGLGRILAFPVFQGSLPAALKDPELIISGGVAYSYVYVPV